MADTRPTPVGFFGAIRLCLLLLFAPRRFIKAQEADGEARSHYTGESPREHSAYVVRRAFLYSFSLVLLFAAGGYGAGLLFVAFVGCAESTFIGPLQIVGAGLLLWGTLFVRGWDIQTYSGVTFVERVNQWLYRFLYCIGTAVLVFSLSWSTCH